MIWGQDSNLVPRGPIDQEIFFKIHLMEWYYVVFYLTLFIIRDVLLTTRLSLGNFQSATSYPTNDTLADRREVLAVHLVVSYYFLFGPSVV